MALLCTCIWHIESQCMDLIWFLQITAHQGIWRVRPTVDFIVRIYIELNIKLFNAILEYFTLDFQQENIDLKR